MFEPGEDERERAENWEPGPEITCEGFLEWSKARRGTFPAEDMTNPVWSWLIDSNIDAYLANRHFVQPDNLESHVGPGWCFNRFGRTLTKLPDGRKIIISGEHEDGYDPDFFIYNDVVIVETDGTFRIFGYPADHFPPTDFHTATLIGNEIILIGNLGYNGQRQLGETQVIALDLATMHFRTIVTAGENPGWISHHETSFNPAAGTFLVRGGKIDHGEKDGGYLENVDDWRLDLRTWEWTRLTKIPISRWRFSREDGNPHWIPPMRMGSYAELLQRIRSWNDPRANNRVECFDQTLLDSLYDPLIPHEVIDGYQTYRSPFRFLVNGVEIEFEEKSSSIEMTAKGELPEVMLADYAEEIRRRLSRLEGGTYQSEKIAER